MGEFLLARALEHDSPTLLFWLGCEYLISARGDPSGTADRAQAGRARPRTGQAGNHHGLAHESTGPRKIALDALLVGDTEVGTIRAGHPSERHPRRRRPVEASPSPAGAWWRTPPPPGHRRPGNEPDPTSRAPADELPADQRVTARRAGGRNTRSGSSRSALRSGVLPLNPGRAPTLLQNPLSSTIDTSSRSPRCSTT